MKANCTYRFQQKTLDFLNQKQQLLINGKWISPKRKEYFPAINPATGSLLCEIPLSDSEDVNHAVEAGNNAFHTQWREMNPEIRAELIFKLADLIERDRQVLIELETLDNGKPLDKASYDITSVIRHFRYYAGWATKLAGSTYPVNKETLVFTKREPLGVVGLIVPWNFPLMIATWKLAPALACGNCCVLKPSEKTSLTALYLGRLIKEVGFPDGVINILTGPGNPTGEALVRHSGIHKISFTGSTAVGKRISGQNEKHKLKRVSLELGGKSPNVIFSDADLDKVFKSLHWSSFYNSGQECTLGSRVYIEKPVFDQVINQLIGQSKKLTIGNGLENPDLGPLIDRQQCQRVLDYIKSGKNDGGKLVLGGQELRIKGLEKGYFISPTIFTHSDDDIRIVQEEIFGPVIVISSFDSFEEVLDRANNSSYGLVAGVWTKDTQKAFRFADKIDTGTVWINGYDQFNPTVPFGGFKESGLGKEMGENALDLYTREKAIWYNY